MYGILAANFFAMWYVFPVILWPPVSWLADGRCKLVICSWCLGPFCRLISEVLWPVVTKLWHMLDGDSSL